LLDIYYVPDHQRKNFGKGWIPIKKPEMGKDVIRDGGWPILQSNCWGTMSYIFEADEAIQEAYVESGYRMGDFSSAHGDFLYFPDSDRPGYVGMRAFEIFLEKYFNLVEGDIDGNPTIKAYYWDAPGSEFFGFELRHAAFPLGPDLLFHQENEGDPFCIISENEYLEKIRKRRMTKMEIKTFSIR